ncbi:hypothetical protein FRC03_010397 [Tulasnella sp. 419]|nr:hypothetical protein FRC02_001940 [Tulasnella sp. 418]KAG8970207.1 hypothetical protein FRC03_010397 [Tulasnella sp. 419]
MMDSPQFLQQMSNMMSNPAVMEQILAADPNLSALGPEFRQFFQSDQFRQMVGNPEALRGMFQMASALRGGGGGGGPFGAPAAGVGAPNSFASLFAQAPTASGANTTATPAAGTTTTPSSGTAPSAGSPPPANPFGVVDPALIEQLLGGPGGAGAFGNPFIPFGAGSPAPAANLPPPEERFQVQLQQLAEMGFTNAQQNIRALLATGGNVQGAIEYILGGGGL